MMKKKYISPAVHVVVIHQAACLLHGTGTPDPKVENVDPNDSNSEEYLGW